MQTKDGVKRSVLHIILSVAWVAHSATYLFIQGIIATIIATLVYFISLVALRTVKKFHSM